MNPHSAAEKALVKIGVPAVEPLMAALQDESWGAHAGAIFCLGEIGDVRAVQPLIEVLRFEDINWDEVYEALTKTKAALVRPLIFALKNNPSAEVRQKSVIILNRLHDPLAFPALMEALEHDTASKVREAAGYVLAEYRDPRVIDPLINLLTDADPSVRETAVRALGETAEAVDRVRVQEPLLRSLRDADWGVRQSAAEMLIRLKLDQNHAAEKLLLADLQNDDAEVRLGAAWSLVELGDARALDPLVRLLYHDDSRISTSAAQALGNLGDQRAATPLNATLNHPEEEVRAAVQTALRQLGHTV